MPLVAGKFKKDLTPRPGGPILPRVKTKSSAPRALAIPPAMETALAANPKAQAAFDQLTAAHKNEYARWIAEAKRTETVQRRLKQFVPMLLAKKGAKSE